MLAGKIRQTANDIFETVKETRRHLHTYPELSFKEYKSSDFIKSSLSKLGIGWTSITDTGIVAIIKGNKPSSSVIALRADIDALPITEQNNVPYISQNEGVMHACGHDAHTASLLGTARILQHIKDDFGGTVKLIFQPGEELLPGGASLMIKNGVLKDPVPQAVLGQHVFPALPAGKIAIRKGTLMASMDEIVITVRGKGGHGAQPHLNIDPVFIAAHVILALQQLVSRISNPVTPSVLSIGKVIANGAINVIPDEVYMEGTFRTIDETWREQAHRHIEEIVTGIAKTMRGSAVVKITKGYPSLVNHEKLTDNIKRYAEEFLGQDNVLDADLWMAAEDFAYYGQEADACFYLLGVGNVEKNIKSGLHTATFNIDENALITGCGLMAYAAVKQLGN